MDDYADLIKQLETNKVEAKPEVEVKTDVNKVNHEEHVTETAKDNKSNDVDDEKDFEYLNKKSTDEDDSDDEDFDDDEIDEQPKNSKGVQKKINKLTKRITDKDVKIDELSRKIEELTLLMAGNESKVNEVPTTKTANKAKAPVYEDFETIEDYMKAMMSHVKNEEIEKERIAKAQKEGQDVLEAAIKKYPDFNKSLEALNKSTPPSKSATDYISNSDITADILYYLSKNLHVAEEISGLKPAQQVKKLVQIEDRLLSRLNRNSSEAKNDLPDPIKPIKRGSGSVDFSTYEGDDLVSRYIKSREKK